MVLDGLSMECCFFAPDGSDSVAASYETAKRNWMDLDKHLNGLTVEKLTALNFYSSVPRYQDQIANALDLWLLIIPNLPIPSLELLNIVPRFQQLSFEVGTNVSSISHG